MTPDNSTNIRASIDVPVNDQGNSSRKMHRVSAEALMQNTREIVIEYQGSDYRLRITSNNKLILTK